MKKTTVMFNYRKCLKCGHTTENMKENACKCGGYLYMMGGCYMPRVHKTAKA